MEAAVICFARELSQYPTRFHPSEVANSVHPGQALQSKNPNAPQFAGLTARPLDGNPDEKNPPRGVMPPNEKTGPDS